MYATENLRTLILSILNRGRQKIAEGCAGLESHHVCRWETANGQGQSGTRTQIHTCFICWKSSGPVMVPKRPLLSSGKAPNSLIQFLSSTLV